MTEKMDSAFFRVFEWIVDKWVFLTGKSNFKLAYIFVGLTALFLPGGLMLQYLENGSGWDVFLSIFIFLACIGAFVKTRELERASRSLEQEGVIPQIILEEKEKERGWRLFLAVFSLFLLPVTIFVQADFAERITDIGYYAYACHKYVMICINPGGKSVFQRAKEGLKKFVFRPALEPVPAGNS